MTKWAEKAFKAHYFSTSDLPFSCPKFCRLERDDTVYVHHLFIVYSVCSSLPAGFQTRLLCWNKVALKVVNALLSEH